MTSLSNYESNFPPVFYVENTKNSVYVEHFFLRVHVHVLTWNVGGCANLSDFV